MTGRMSSKDARQVARQLHAEGLNNAQIAARLHLNVGRVVAWLR